MLGCVRLSSLIAFAAALAGTVTLADAPQRVVSVNLCTDQLALMLAAEGQLISVSYLAQDARSSGMAAAARALPANYGLAEEIFLLDPDLVLAGQFTTRETVAMLRRLGTPVVTMAPAYSLEDVRDRIAEMGRHLGREAAAADLVARLDAGLAAVRAEAPEHRPRAAVYSARGYMSGPASLSGAILEAAGFANVAAERGLSIGARLPLEELVMLDPDLVVLPTPWPGASHAEEMLTHPALRALQERAGTAPLTDRDWACGTPHVLRAVAELAAARRVLERAR